MKSRQFFKNIRQRGAIALQPEGKLLHIGDNAVRGNAVIARESGDLVQPAAPGRDAAPADARVRGHDLGQQGGDLDRVPALCPL